MTNSDTVIDRPPPQASALPAVEDTLMFREAASAADAVARFLAGNEAALGAIATRLRDRPPVFVTTCGRGSSDHAATYAKYLIETYLGIPTTSAALSVASIYGSPVKAADSLCLAISQSGRSPDLLATVAAQQRGGAFVVALVNETASPLAAMADAVLPLMAGPELSVAATKSYIATLAGIAALTARWSGDEDLTTAVAGLPNLLGKAFALDWSSALGLADHAAGLFVIGRGYGMGIVQEAALKLKETCGLHAEAFSSAEVEHGPMAIVKDGFPVLAFATSDAAGDGVRAIVRTFTSRGARVQMADAAHPHAGLPAITALPAIEPILMIQSFYRYVNALSLARGYNPDVPPHLNKVTRTQ